MIRYHYTGDGARGFATYASGYAPERLIALYQSMLRIRRIEEEIERRYHQDQMKTPIHLVIGQEAACVGACEALRATDLVYSSHRTHGAYLAKGGDLKAMLCEMHCRANGCVGSRGGWRTERGDCTE
jgi:TPP-dependent pyruvate/acetoin dehydrogenase alpha subunit